jgi:hypothetical protein
VPDQPELPIPAKPARKRRWAIGPLDGPAATAVIGFLLMVIDGSIESPLARAGAVLVLAGLGAIATWLPFDWRNLLLRQIRLGSLREAARSLLPVTCAIVFAAIFTVLQNDPASKSKLVVLYLAAALSLISAALRSRNRPLAHWIVRWLSAAAAAGFVAGLAQHNSSQSLAIQSASGHRYGLLTCGWGFLELLLLAAVSNSPAKDGRTGRAAHKLLLLDLAGFPPLPGFWLRLNLLLALITQQRTSNISGEFEAHSGMLLLAALFALAWGMGAASLAAEALSSREEHDFQNAPTGHTTM